MEYNNQNTSNEILIEMAICMKIEDFVKIIKGDTEPVKHDPVKIPKNLKKYDKLYILKQEAKRVLEI